MNKTIIFAVGGLAVLLIVAVPFIFSGMKDNDFNNLQGGIQNAKRRAGVWIEDDYTNRKRKSYTQRYIEGDFNE